MTLYQSHVNAAVAWAREDALYNQYRAEGRLLAAGMRLADHWGTWVAYDARKAMGHVA